MDDQPRTTLNETITFHLAGWCICCGTTMLFGSETLGEFVVNLTCPFGTVGKYRVRVTEQ